MPRISTLPPPTAGPRARPRRGRRAGSIASPGPRTIDRAVVLAGGKGTRLRPYTTLIPKPLVPIEDRPILEFVLDRLREAGFRRVTLCVGHLAELIRAFFGDGRAWGVELDYVVEAVPLSTIGPLAFVPDLGENFLVMNGDVLTDLDPARLMRAHLRSRADLTVATYRRQVNVDYGVIRYGGRDLRVRGFVEKPSIPYDVSMGIYALHRRCLDLIEPGRPLGFDELIQRLLDRRRPVRAFPHDGAWLDVGRPEDYELAQSWRPRRDGASAGGQRGRRAGPRTQGGASRR